MTVTYQHNCIDIYFLSNFSIIFRPKSFIKLRILLQSLEASFIKLQIRICGFFNDFILVFVQWNLQKAVTRGMQKVAAFHG